MRFIKFIKVICVNNELEGHSSKNLLLPEVDSRKSWLCEKGTSKGIVLLQLECPTVITAIRIGNAHSAFIEVLVGRTGDPTDKFQTLLPSSMFMNLYDSKSSTKPDQVKFFYEKDFCASAASKEWQLIQVVCTQPFNDRVPFGICFIRITGLGDALSVVSQKSEKSETGTGAVSHPPFTTVKKVGTGDSPELPRTTTKRDLLEAEKMCKKNVKEGDEGRRATVFLPGKISNSEAAMRKMVLGRGPTYKKKKQVGASAVDRRRTENHLEGRRGFQREPPFSKLMADVIFVVRGFKNPAKDEIRSRALRMGATYSSEWSARCTHLICSYLKSAKYNEVKGKGKIVRMEWIDDCFKDKKRYPWRRYALDPEEAKAPESEEEIVAALEEDEGYPEVHSLPEVIKSTRDREAGDVYHAETDDERSASVDTTDYPLPFLPDIFAGRKFCVDRNLLSRRDIERCIVAFNGHLRDTVNEDVDFYITNTGGAVLKILRKKAPGLSAVKPGWIWEMTALRQWVSPWSFLLSQPHSVGTHSRYI